MTIDHLDRLVERLRSNVLRRRSQMQPLPGASCRNRLGHIQSVRYQNHPEYRRGRRMNVARRIDPDPIDPRRTWTASDGYAPADATLGSDNDLFGTTGSALF